jgi:2Fe-2S ferredoxin
MAIIKVLPHEVLVPEGLSFQADPDKSLCQQLLDQGIEIEHACGMVAACTTCHVIVRSGFDHLVPATDSEDDLLDKAWGLTPTSRLSCQVHAVTDDLTIELPKYTLNHARE